MFLTLNLRRPMPYSSPNNMQKVLALAADAEGRVRCAAAAELAVVAAALGRERAARYLRTPLLMLLTDVQVSAVAVHHDVLSADCNVRDTLHACSLHSHTCILDPQSLP